MLSWKSKRVSGYYIYIAELDGEVAGYVCYGDTPLTGSHLGYLLDSRRP